MTIQQCFQNALQYHQAGRLADAEALYRQILAVEPHQAEAFHLLGVIATQTGRHDLAVDLIGRALALQPGNPEAHYNLGIALKENGQLHEAIAAYRQAVVLRPGFPEAYNNLGIALKDNGQFDEAIAAYREAITLKPDYPGAHCSLGNALSGQGQFDEAIVAYHQAIILRPDYPEAHCGLGNALYGKGQLDGAIVAYHQAIALKSDFPEAHRNLGQALQDKGQLDEAIAAYHQALKLRPGFPEVHRNLGHALQDKGRLDEAIAAYRQAIALKPDYPEAHSSLGTALQDKGQLDEAIAAYHQAAALKPDYAEAYYNLGLAMCEKGRFDEDIAACRRAIWLNPDLPEAHFHLAFALLMQGDFVSGWEEFEWRWQLKDGAALHRDFLQPRWDGGPLNGRTILLHAEQGFGDTLQFIRYAPLVAQRGGRVTVECQPALATLLAGVEGIAQIVSHGDPLPAFDVHCPLMSLPLAFGTRLETVPADIPYLRANTRKVAHWRERLARESTSLDETESLKVGLVWAGGLRPDQPIANRTDRRRSMALSQFAPLAEVAGVVFVSLQKGEPAEQAQRPPAALRLLDWTAELEDFADTAALIECLDLVISVDTAVAHLAGALGKPVWVLNRSDTCWRWQLDRTDSPWYPTMRLFRQPQPMEWEPVIQRVGEELAAVVRKT